jgi:aspartyl-tRNA(Asn)/glutamyl-tRNA(Gln) amidotransferase subunit B
VLTSQKSLADYFEIMLQANESNAKLCANWVMGELSALLNKNVDIKFCAHDAFMK